MDRTAFSDAIVANSSAFGLFFTPEEIARLAEYYHLVLQENVRLHLVAPCPPEKFAVRHILESIVMTRYIPIGGSFVDVGTGAGLPAIPCLIVRPDISAVLIESKLKKAAFLSATIESLGLSSRASLADKQFSETPPPDTDFVSCRALDGFLRRLPQLLKWTGNSGILFFGGPELGEGIRRTGRKIESLLLPLSKRRYLFISQPVSNGD